MTERDPSPIDAALDLLVYAPAGLALTLGEEIPKLAAKGRARLAGPFGVASMVGRFAVAQGRRELDRRLGVRPSAGPASNGSEAASAAADDLAAEELVAEELVADDVVADDVVADDVVGEDFAAGVTEPDGVVEEVPATSSTTPPAAPAPAVESLAIHGYDSLSASQVVQRLAGLSVPELEAVRAYESAGRGRRTILARIAQLQGG